MKKLHLYNLPLIRLAHIPLNKYHAVYVQEDEDALAVMDVVRTMPMKEVIHVEFAWAPEYVQSV